MIEGDEYDTAFFDKGPKFMHYRPDTALIGTVEFDHADIYRDEAEVKKVFRWLTNIVPRRGLIVRHEDCESTVEVTAHAQARVQGYGFASAPGAPASIVHGADGVSLPGHARRRDSSPTCRSAISGEYNVRNALAVMAAADGAGADRPPRSPRGLATFRGVRRRMEVKGRWAAFSSSTTSRTTRPRSPRRFARCGSAIPGRRVWCVLEPRSWSLAAQRLSGHAARPRSTTPTRSCSPRCSAPTSSLAEERLDPERLVADLARRGRTARFLPGSRRDRRVTSWTDARPEDVVAVLSNGGFGGIHEQAVWRRSKPRCGHKAGRRHQCRRPGTTSV